MKEKLIKEKEMLETKWLLEAIIRTKQATIRSYPEPVPAVNVIAMFDDVIPKLRKLLEYELKEVE